MQVGRCSTAGVDIHLAVRLRAEAAVTVNGVLVVLTDYRHRCRAAVHDEQPASTERDEGVAARRFSDWADWRVVGSQP